MECGVWLVLLALVTMSDVRSGPLWDAQIQRYRPHLSPTRLTSHPEEEMSEMCLLMSDDTWLTWHMTGDQPLMVVTAVSPGRGELGTRSREINGEHSETLTGTWWTYFISCCCHSTLEVQVEMLWPSIRSNLIENCTAMAQLSKVDEKINGRWTLQPRWAVWIKLEMFSIYPRPVS